MKDSTKRILLIGGSLLVIGGIAYYFLVYKPNHPKKDDNVDGDKNKELPPDQVLENKPAITDTTLSTPPELNSTDKIKAFQDWMDTIGPWVKGSDGKYKLLNKGAGYGVFGPSTKAAWDYYKSKYFAEKGSNTAIYKPLKEAYDYLVAVYPNKDKEAFRKRLTGYWDDFVISWANAHKKYVKGQLPKNSFIWSNNIYGVIYGQQIDKDFYLNGGVTPQKEGTWQLRELPDSNSSGATVPKTQDLGLVKDWMYNLKSGTLYLYVPNNPIGPRYKWLVWKVMK